MTIFLTIMTSKGLTWPPALLIALGAIGGALARFYINEYCVRQFGATFPWGTFFINLSGAFLMGAVSGLVWQKILVSVDLELFFTIGCLGSYTTFSTYALETSGLLRQGHYSRAAVYGGGSVILGGICLELGRICAQWWQ
jgi:CrcB protein